MPSAAAQTRPRTLGICQRPGAPRAAFSTGPEPLTHHTTQGGHDPWSLPTLPTSTILDGATVFSNCRVWLVKCVTGPSLPNPLLPWQRRPERQPPITDWSWECVHILIVPQLQACLACAHCLGRNMCPQRHAEWTLAPGGTPSCRSPGQTVDRVFAQRTARGERGCEWSCGLHGILALGPSPGWPRGPVTSPSSCPSSVKWNMSTPFQGIPEGLC